MDNPCAIGNRLTRKDNRGPRRNAVIGKDRCKRAGGCVDQRHPGAGHQSSVFAVEDQTKGISQHRNQRSADRGSGFGLLDRYGDLVTRFHAQDAVPGRDRRRNCARSDCTGEGAGVGTGLEHGEDFAVAPGSGDDCGDVFHSSRIAIGQRRIEPQDQCLADPHLARKLDGDRLCASAGSAGKWQWRSTTESFAHRQ